MNKLSETITNTLLNLLRGVVGLVLSMALYMSYNYYNESFLKIFPLIGIAFVGKTWSISSVKREVAREMIKEELANQERKVS